MSNKWRTIELVIGGKVFATQCGETSSECGALIEGFKEAASISNDEWQIYLYKKSRANNLIPFLFEPKEEKKKVLISKSRTFDIVELNQLREKGYSWQKIGKQLYSNERAVREYFRDHKHELYDTDKS